MQSIHRFRDELFKFRHEGVGTIIIGDINVHSKRWLRYSKSNSAEGELLRLYCNELGLRQIVKEPTRYDNLLDLVFTDMSDIISEVGPRVADHNYVVATTDVDVPEDVVVERSVWNYKKADWTLLQEQLEDHDWSFLLEMDTSAGAEKLTSTILEFANEAIGKRLLKERKSTHPWLTDRAVKAVFERDAAAGTEDEKIAVLECSRIMREEREAYIVKVKQEILNLPQGSKQWWTKVRGLLGDEVKKCNIPALKEEDGTWIIEAKGNANLLARTMHEKCNLRERRTPIHKVRANSNSAMGTSDADGGRCRKKYGQSYRRFWYGAG